MGQMMLVWAILPALPQTPLNTKGSICLKDLGGASGTLGSSGSHDCRVLDHRSWARAGPLPLDRIRIGVVADRTECRYHRAACSGTAGDW